MSVYTTPLKDALEAEGGRYYTVNGRTIIEGAEHIGLAYYPIFDEEYRETLNGIIFDRYMNREIGMESISMFRLAMRRRMNEVMPYFNKQYESTRVKFDPLKTVDMRTVTDGEAESESKSQASNTSSAETKSGTRAINSEFPQSMLSGDADYATAGADTNASTNTSGEGSEAAESRTGTKSKGESLMTGYQGNPSGLLRDYRESLVNVDMMVLESLNDLFMLVWDVPNFYTGRN